MDSRIVIAQAVLCTAETDEDRAAAWLAYMRLRCEVAGGSVRIFSDEEVNSIIDSSVAQWDVSNQSQRPG